MKKFRIVSLVLFCISLILKFLSNRYREVVESLYSSKIDIYIVKFLNKLSSGVYFSCFEIIIYIFVLSIIISILYLIYIFIKNRNEFLCKLKNTVLNYISVVFVVYFLFISLWGLNYNRVSLQQKLVDCYNLKNNSDIDIDDKKFSVDELENLCKFLIEKCNESKKTVDNLDIKIDKSYSKKFIDDLENAYDNVELLGINELGSYKKAKVILNSRLLSYTGITGIYSPFTGEANVNINQPMISMPFTILHEMAHQRGYAYESEANFLAYISCIENKDSYVRYSGYFMALRYSLIALIRADVIRYEDIKSEISKSVVNDLNDYSEFWKKYDSKASDISDSVNNMYLKSNSVEEGTKSYGKVVDLLLLYYYLYSE